MTKQEQSQKNQKLENQHIRLLNFNKKIKKLTQNTDTAKLLAKQLSRLIKANKF